MTYKENIKAILECNFSGFKEEIIDSACERILEIEQEPKILHCKDCKWWKDSDGLYRRGCHAESKCPINRREVYEGNGYCYMFEPQERSGEE